MATTETLMAQLLAPLPSEVEQADTPAFRKQMLADAKEAWLDRMQFVHASDYERNGAHMRWLIASRRGAVEEPATKAAWNSAEQAHFAEVGRQMLIPAPTITALRWKQGTCRYRGGSADWDIQIAADEARLLVRASGGTA